MEPPAPDAKLYALSSRDVWEDVVVRTVLMPGEAFTDSDRAQKDVMRVAKRRDNLERYLDVVAPPEHALALVSFLRGGRGNEWIPCVEGRLAYTLPGPRTGVGAAPPHP